MAKSSSTPGSASVVNSTYTPLGVGGVFLGEYEDLLDYSLVTLTAFSDKDSIVDGLEFQWSGDGVNTDQTERSRLVANVGRAFALTPRGRYFRVKFTNNSVAETVLRITTSYRTGGTGIISRPLDFAMSEENFAHTIRAVMASKQLDGTFVNAGVAAPFPCLDSGSGKTLKSAAFNLAATGTVVAAVAGKRIKVYSAKLVTRNNDLDANFRSGAATALEGPQFFLKGGGYVETVNPPAFLFATTAGERLDLVLSGDGASGRVSYWDDDAT